MVMLPLMLASLLKELQKYPLKEIPAYVDWQQGRHCEVEARGALEAQPPDIDCNSSIIGCRGRAKIKKLDFELACKLPPLSWSP